MMGGPLIGLVGMLVLVVVLGAIITSIVAAVVRWRNRVRQPCCGACRYPVEGLTSFTCPECGADLRAAGILVPGVRPKHRVHLAEMLAAWAAVAVFCGLISTMVIGSTNFGQRMSYWRNDTLTPRSGAAGPILVSATGEAQPGTQIASIPAQRLVLQPAPANPATPFLLEIDYRDGTWSMPPGVSTPGAPAKAQKLPVTSADVSAWLVASFPSSTSMPQDEVNLLTAYINGGGLTADALAFGPVSGGSGAAIGPAPWVIVANLAVWPLIFAAGCVLILKAASTRDRVARSDTAAKRAVPVAAT